MHVPRLVVTVLQDIAHLENIVVHLGQHPLQANGQGVAQVAVGQFGAGQGVFMHHPQVARQQPGDAQRNQQGQQHQAMGQITDERHAVSQWVEQFGQTGFYCKNKYLLRR